MTSSVALVPWILADHRRRIGRSDECRAVAAAAAAAVRIDGRIHAVVRSQVPGPRLEWADCEIDRNTTFDAANEYFVLAPSETTFWRFLDDRKCAQLLFAEVDHCHATSENIIDKLTRFNLTQVKPSLFCMGFFRPVCRIAFIPFQIHIWHSCHGIFSYSDCQFYVTYVHFIVIAIRLWAITCVDAKQTCCRQKIDPQLKCQNL